jgi:subtilase family serine protease
LSRIARLVLSFAILGGLLASSRPSLAASGPPLVPNCVFRTDGKQCYGPRQMRAAYGISPLLRSGVQGQGVTIAIIVSFGSPTIRADLHAFDTAFGLPDPKLTVAAPLGRKPTTDGGWTGETTLDVEWSHAVAPRAKILLLESPVDETEGTIGLPQFLKLEEYAVAHGASVISQSWGATEDTLMDAKGRALIAKYHAFFASATKKGVTFTSGSGDDGAAGLDLSLKHYFTHRVVQWPAADPYVLAVGGTQLVVTRSGRDEVTWPRSGGGFSKVYAEPGYERTLGSSYQIELRGRRGVPDVAYNAAGESATLIYMNGGWRGVGGTSAGAPQWAGIVALADNLAHRRLGDVHAILYRIARGGAYHTDFHDITSGSITDPTGLATPLVPLRASRGWDPATGLGSPNVRNLVRDMVRLSKTG